MNRHTQGSVATYVIIALILAVITYIEFAIVEYEIAWLSRNAVMFWLILLSVVKFVLVIMFFMHLKGDDKVYSGFFTSGMIMALGTFIGLAFLFTVTSTSNYTFTNESPAALEEVAAPGAPGPVDQSQPVVPPAASDQDAFAVGDEGTVATTVAAFDTAAAEAAYMANCSSCHQASGAGLPGAFPPFNEGHAAEVYNAEGGRAVLLHTVLFGLQGPIEVHGTTYNSAMPAWPQLSDSDIAGVLNHITNAWGNADALVDFEPYTADQVAAERGAGLNPSDVHAARVALDLSAAPAGEAAEADEADEADEATEEVAEDAAEEVVDEAAEEVTEEAPAEEAAEEAATEDAATEEPLAAPAGVDLAAGQAAYAVCSGCHQADGSGIPGAFPPLAGHVSDIYNAGGRDVLLHTVLFGMQGPIEVDGSTYNGAMPAWGSMTDENLALVLNYISSDWGNADQIADFEPYTTEEVAAARGLGLSPTEVHAERVALGEAEGAPADGDESDADEATADEAAEEAAEEPADDEVAAANGAETAATADFDREAAEAAYMANCSSCHNAEGVGITMVFPPLAGHANEVYNAGGREFLQHVLLYGMTGQITVDGNAYSGAMPAWQQLDDETLAGIYNHIVTAWGNEDNLEDFTPMTADEFAAQRGLGLSTSDVYAERQALGLD